MGVLYLLAGWVVVYSVEMGWDGMEGARAGDGMEGALWTKERAHEVWLCI
jgi:hypothetical protein